MSDSTDLRGRLQRTLSGTYTIERELGGGGMSRVFVAEETALGRQVVIKVLAPELTEGFSAERFIREIRLAAKLQHPNIVPLLRADAGDGTPWYAMPFVRGDSLRARIGSMDSRGALRVIVDVTRALAYAHENGVVHRDIKPENILLSGDVAVVTDFGIAKAVSAAHTEGGGGAITQTGTSIGTPAYMAPEQAAGAPDIDHRADLYSLGVVAYELLARRHPFADKQGAQQLVVAHLTETPAPLDRLAPGVPPNVVQIVMQCLAKDPAARPASAAAILEAIESPSREPIPHAVSGSAARPEPKSRVRIGMLVAVIAVAVAVGVWLLRPHGGSAGASTTRSLAVLPIENAGGDSTKEYLADGMTSELAGNLRQTPGLTVVGDLSTSRFKRSQLSPTQIAQQLGVAMLLTGKLQSMGGKIRLQMQLNDATGKLLWSNQFDREMKDNFAVQDEVTAAIVSEMRLVLSPASTAVAHAGRTENPAAHDLYMRAMFEKNKLDAAGLQRAETLFKQALALDPGYAQAHAGLAFAYDIQADVYAPSHEYHLLALKEARLAVAADSQLAEARVVLGFELAAANWDFRNGLAEMNRGLALNPSSPDALFMVAGFSLLSGNTARALALADSLIQVDPLSPIGPHTRAEALLWAGRWQEALQQKLAAKKIDPTVTLIDVTDATALQELGRLDEALAAYLDFRKIADVPSFGLVTTYWRMGRHDDAMREIRAMEARSQKEWIDPDFIALSYAGIGDRDNTMKWLEKAFDMKTYFVRLFLNWDMPWLRSMQDDPRYIALRKKVLVTTFKE